MRRRGALPYLPGLDGLRAIAVVAVLLYHGQDVQALPSVLKPQGGFLGVEVFFVISGFLITALLLREHAEGGRIDIKQFWLRRARRLLPALYVFLTGTIALAALFATDAFDRIRAEIAGALFYVSNWLLIASDQSYFEASGRPSLLRHLWSLAIEEQFYLVWPLIVIAGLRFGGLKVLFTFTVVAAAASTAWLWLLFDRVEQYGDVTSVYYRTDARAAALLLGGALAMVWKPWEVGPLRPMARRLLEIFGLMSLGLVVAMQYLFTDRVVEWASYQRLYHGGFLALSCSTMVVIAAVSVPHSRLGRLIGNPVSRWIGTRSYGLYLWHWPVYQLTRPRVDVDLDGYPLLGLRLAITMVLVEISYRVIEAPIRERRFTSMLRRAVQTPRGIGLTTVGALGIVAVTVAVAIMVPTIDRSPSERVDAAQASQTVTDAGAASADKGGADSGNADAIPNPTQPPNPNSSDPDPADPNSSDPNNSDPDPADPNSSDPNNSDPDPADPNSSDPNNSDPDPADLREGERATVDAVFSPGVVVELLPDQDAALLAPPTAGPSPTPTQEPLPPPPPLSAPFDINASRIHIVGDSVVEGAQSQLYRISPNVTVDGEIGRQWWQLEGELRRMRASGLANDVVVIQLGNNGNFTTEMFDRVMNALSGVRLVLFVNVHAPVVWEAEVNTMLARNVNRYPNQARLLDWYSASIDHPEYFIEDGTHLQGPGMVAFRLLIENSLRSLS